MATLGQDLRAFIVGSTSILAQFPTAAQRDAVEIDRIPQQPPRPRMWMQRRREEEHLTLAGQNETSVGGLVESEWDLEIISTDHDERYNITQVTKRRLNGYLGTMGTRKVQGIFVDDHDDDYIPRGLAGDEAFYVAALSVTIWSPST